MSNAAFVYVNLADSGTVTASSAIAQAPPSTLQDPHVARRWRGSSGATEYVLVDLGSSKSIDVVALLGITTLTVAATTRVRISTADATGVAGNAYDSTALLGQVSEDYDCLIDVLPAAVTGRYVRIDMTEVGLTYIEAGRLVVGRTSTFDINFAAGWSRQWVDRSRKTEARGGQMYIDVDVSYRVLNLTFEHILESERYSFVEQIDMLNGVHTDILLLTDPTSSNLGRDSIWGLVEDVSPVVQPFVSSEAIFQKTYQVRERL